MSGVGYSGQRIEDLLGETMSDVHSRPPVARIDVRVEGRMHGGQYSVLQGTLVVTCDGGQSVAMLLGDSPAEPAARLLLRQLVERGRAAVGSSTSLGG